MINHDHHILNSSVTNTVCENEVVALEVHDSVRARERARLRAGNEPPDSVVKYK